MAISGSTVTLTMDDYNALQDAKRQAENAAADLRKQLIEAQLNAGGDGLVRELTASQRRMLAIVRFAVANMPPETVRGWPYETLVEVSHDIEKLANATMDDASFAIELRKFATECEKIEQERARRKPAVVETVNMRPAGAP